MPTVGDLFHKLSRDEVLEAFAKNYPDDAHRMLRYESQWEYILNLAPQPTKYLCLVGQMKFDTYCIVIIRGIIPGDSELYFIEYIPWNCWLSMEVVLKAPDFPDLSEVDILSHILWEMNWADFMEDRPY